MRAASAFADKVCWNWVWRRTARRDAHIYIQRRVPCFVVIGAVGRDDSAPVPPCGAGVADPELVGQNQPTNRVLPSASPACTHGHCPSASQAFHANGRRVPVGPRLARTSNKYRTCPSGAACGMWRANLPQGVSNTRTGHCRGHQPLPTSGGLPTKLAQPIRARGDTRATIGCYARGGSNKAILV